MNRSYQLRHAFLLVLTALIWGCAFVAQSVSMDYIGPMTFICIRFFMGAAILIPTVMILDRFRRKKVGGGETTGDNVELFQMVSWKNPVLVKSGILCGIFLFTASTLQQYGLKYTSPGKAGFITAFYIIFVPIANLILFRKKCPLLTWIAVALAFAGLYFLSISGVTKIQAGDIIIFLSAFFYTGQILTIDHFIHKVDGVKMSCIQFLVCGVLGLIFMLILENPNMGQVIKAGIPILYTGIMSTGVAYTLQISGQKGVNPTLASLLMSLESVFATLASFVILHEILSGREILGCVIMFAAIVLAQLPAPSPKKKMQDI